jgi:hypothetical protein
MTRNLYIRRNYYRFINKKVEAVSKILPGVKISRNNVLLTKIARVDEI